VPEHKKQWILKDEALTKAKAQEKCTKQFVPIAKMNVKYLLSRQKTDQSIAETVTLSTRSSRLTFFDAF